MRTIDIGIVGEYLGVEGRLGCPDDHFASLVATPDFDRGRCLQALDSSKLSKPVRQSSSLPERGKTAAASPPFAKSSASVA